MACDCFIFSHRPKAHNCNGPAVDVKDANFQMTEYFFEEGYLGLTVEDLNELLHVCDTCLRIHLLSAAGTHKCPADARDGDFVDTDLD